MGSDTEDHRHSWTFTGLSVDAPQHVIGRDVILEPERVEQALLHHETLAHHGPILLLRMPHQGITIRRQSRGLFNEICQ
jgi:hypothetical protein